MELATIAQSTCPACHGKLLPKRVPERIAEKRRFLLSMMGGTLQKDRGCQVTASKTVRDSANSAKKVVRLDGFSPALVTRLFEDLPAPERIQTTRGTYGSGSWHHQLSMKWLIDDCDTLASTFRLEEGSPRLEELCRGPAKLLRQGKTLCAIIPPLSISYDQRSDKKGPYSQRLAVVYRVARMPTAPPHNLLLPASLGEELSSEHLETLQYYMAERPQEFSSSHLLEDEERPLTPE